MRRVPSAGSRDPYGRHRQSWRTDISSTPAIPMPTYTYIHAWQHAKLPL